MTHPTEPDLGPLTWVKNEIDLALARADESLEKVAETSDPAAHIQFAQTHLHQVRGALSIVGLDGLTQFASALDQSLGTLSRGQGPVNTASLAVARRALAMIGNYLEELVHGTPDQPLRLLPLYREIQSLRSADPVSPAELFFPDLSQRPPRRQIATQELTAEVRQTQQRAQRAAFQRGLLQWLRTPTDPTGPTAMLNAVKGMEALHSGAPIPNLWYAGQAFLEALVYGDLPAQPDIKRLCSQLDAQLKRIAEDAAAVPERLVRELLYWTAQAPARSPQQHAVRATWHLDALIPEAGSSVSVTPLAPLLKSLQTSMAATKQAWDEFSEGQAAALPRFASNLADLTAQAPQLGRPALDRLLECVIEFVRWLRKDPLRDNDQIAIEVATALLLADSALGRGAPDAGFSAQVADTAGRLQALARGETVEAAEHSATVETARRQQEREAVGQLAREILSSLAQVEQILDDYFRNQQKRAPLAGLATPLKQVEGALTLIGDAQAIALVHNAAAAVARLAAGDGTPAAGEFETLAQRLSALGFYVQALQYGPADLQQFLEPGVPRTAPAVEEAPAITIEIPRIAAAPAVPAPDRPRAAAPASPAPPAEPAVEPVAAPEPAAAADLPASLAVTAEPVETAALPGTGESAPADTVAELPITAPSTGAAEPPAPAAPTVEVAAPPAPAAEEIDAELLEIFIEEAHEVLANIGEQLELSRTSPDETEHLTSIRRGFHTLKGSGRMVGLRDLGDAAWGLEQTLNRWLQLEWPPSPALHHLIGAAHETFSAWVGELEAGGGQAREVSALMAEAERLRSSDTPIAEPAPVESAPHAAQPEEIAQIGEFAFGFDALEHAENGEILPFGATPETATEPAEEIALGAAPEAVLPDQTAPPGTFAPDEVAAIAQTPDVAADLEVEAAAEIPLVEELSLESEAEWLAEPELAGAGLADAALVDEWLLEEPLAEEPSPDERPTLEPVAEIAQPVESFDTGATDEGAGETIEIGEIEELISLEEPLEAAVAPVAPGEMPADESPALLLPEEPERGAGDVESAPEEAAEPAPATGTAPATPAEEGTAFLPEVEFPPMAGMLPDTVLPSGLEGVADAVPESEILARAQFGAPLTDETVEDETTEPLEEFETPVERDVVRIGDNEVSRPLYDLYLGEARHHLVTLRGEFVRLAANPTLVPAETALRAAHTLAGISGTTRIMSVQALARALEHAIDRLREGAHPPTAEQTAVLKSTNDTLEAMLAEVASRQMPLEIPELAGQLDGIGRTIPLDVGMEVVATDAPAAGPRPAAPLAEEAPGRQAAVTDDLDDQLLPVFLEEGAELIAQLHATLRTWSSGDTTTDHAKATARLLHTLKGSARMAGAMTLGEHVHQLESHLEAARKSGQDPAGLVDELVAGIDRAEQLVAALTGPAEPAPAEAETGASAATETAETESTGATATLRVRADTVDRFVNEAGEIGIARTRIAGELRTLRRSLLDLTENVIRLRNQLREVEIQADVQMQSRIAHTGTGDEDFDPLEMDRYTRLQELTRMMAESVGDVTTVQQSLLRNLDGAELALNSQARMSRDLQQALMQVRMVPFDSLADRLYRVTRQTAKDLDKRANLDLRGGRIEIDRSVLEHITAPLEHLLRNAIAHGIESPETRSATGKSQIGQITLTVSQEGNEIAISLADDGGGLDYDRIAERARASGLLGADEVADERRLTNLIFLPGFSTAGNISTVSGRGVGMDVVKSETAAVGGRIDIRATRGKGTEFRIYLPLTLAVTQALLVSAGARTWAIPSSMIAQVLELKTDALQALRAAGGTDWQNVHFNYRYLPRLLGDRVSQPEEQRFNWVLLLRAGAQTLALHVDALRGNQEIVVKNAGPQLARIVGISGATVLGDGEIVLILNPVALASRSLTAGEAFAATGSDADTFEALEPLEATGPAVQPTVMVVDDSLTVRKITGRLLEREGYRVITAKDGVEALERLLETVPDVILSDIEMPRMDGFDLLRNIRADERTSKVPVIMITSRLADKHRQLAEKIGANEYLGKPYEEGELLTLLRTYTARNTAEA